MGFVRFAIALDHALKAELAGTGFGDGNTYEATCMRDHKVDVSGGDLLGGNDNVAFVFAVGVVGDDDHASAANVGNDVGYGCEHLFFFGRLGSGGVGFIFLGFRDLRADSEDFFPDECVGVGKCAIAVLGFDETYELGCKLRS